MMPYSYSEKNMLYSEAQFARALNAVGVKTDAQAALRGEARFTVESLAHGGANPSGAYWPPSLPENASLKRTLFATLAAAPLRGAA